MDGPGFDSDRGKGISLLQNVQTGSGAHTATNSMGTGFSFPGVKRPGPVVDHLLLVAR
jgi:hypothetical protein